MGSGHPHFPHVAKEKVSKQKANHLLGITQSESGFVFNKLFLHPLLLQKATHAKP